MRYETALVVSGVRLGDPESLMRIAANDTLSELSWSSVDGRVQVIVRTDEGRDPVAHACEVAHMVEHALPGARAERVDEDLVTATEIAERSGLSREMVRLLASGRRGPGGFPQHRMSVGGGTRGPLRAWAWAEVAAWLAEHYELRQEHLLPTPAQTAALNAHLLRVDQRFDQDYREAVTARVSQEVTCAANGVYVIGVGTWAVAKAAWEAHEPPGHVEGWSAARGLDVLAGRR